METNLGVNQQISANKSKLTPLPIKETRGVPTALGTTLTLPLVFLFEKGRRGKCCIEVYTPQSGGAERVVWSPVLHQGREDRRV